MRKIKDTEERETERKNGMKKWKPQKKRENGIESSAGKTSAFTKVDRAPFSFIVLKAPSWKQRCEMSSPRNAQTSVQQKRHFFDTRGHLLQAIETISTENFFPEDTSETKHIQAKSTLESLHFSFLRHDVVFVRGAAPR